MSSSSRDTPRLRFGLNPLMTASLGSSSHNLQPHGTPISALSMASSHLVSAQTPGSAIQPYNPQEWVASPAQTVDRQSSYTAEPHGEHPTSPPIVSAGYAYQQVANMICSPATQCQDRLRLRRLIARRGQRPASIVIDHGGSPSNGSLAQPPPRIPASNIQPPVSQNFPPPPGSRGASRERRFGLPSFGRRNRDSDQPATPEPHHQTRQSMGPSSFYSPELSRPSSTVSHSGPLTPQAGPPGARRAVSAGAVETPTSARSRSGSQVRGELGMAVPPPPPGPPPASSRSQSVQGMDRTAVPIISPPTRRPRPAASTLGPVPPTPAGWVEGSREPEPTMAVDRNHAGLTVDTETAQTAANVPDAPGSSSSASGLNRAKAVRHDKTILQRRTESRTRHGERQSMDEGSRPHGISDIVVPSGSSNGATPPRPPKPTTPRGGHPIETPHTGESSTTADSRNSTPRTAGTMQNPNPLDTATPPFSPFYPKSVPRTTAGASSSSAAPKSLPTPPPQVRSASSSHPRDSSRPPASLCTPISKHLVITQSAEQFAAGTIERFQSFAAHEAVAQTDADRVRLFADFMVNESRIRRERYSTAIGAMGSEIFDLTRDLFRPMMPPRTASVTSHDEWTPQSSEPTRSQRGSFGAVLAGEAGPSSEPTSANRLPPSPSTSGQAPVMGSSSYMPSLSPILSMSVSDNHGDGSSRGRSSSRWWEADSQGDPSRRIERSKRESKYMGLPKHQWAEADPSDSSHDNPSNDGSGWSGTEYPPEKTGWHDKNESATTPQPWAASSTQTPIRSHEPMERQALDVSRLVTLPPPYPRHHPAVNNNHPELASIRNSVREISDMSELERIKQAFAKESSKRREEFEGAASERWRSLRANLHQEVSSGNLGYADAGAIEMDFRQQENERKKDLEKSEYEAFQDQVVMPANDMLSRRIETATELYTNLSRTLSDLQNNDADMPQEEGDDRPELLEKLTLLKWVFEARETLHRAIYDILSDRNNKFREVVVLPYRLANNTEKATSAEAFFDADSRQRENAMAREVLERTRHLGVVVDDAVQRGVALQLSAFWDIAPALSGLLESIPPDLAGFTIHVPPSELEENPAYVDHPMQYLLTLVHHTEKSTYQFIEAHTNLLCLLHEVKEAIATAEARVVATQVDSADGADDGGATPTKADRQEAARAMRAAEEVRLTEDLQDKVRLVQDQWDSALANKIRAVKETTAEWLLDTGGWDETLIEDGGASV
ncbi:hypothetical protein GMORB2_4999 [Geosmithia morbida]|uniref:Uncharacterized protein n=1 Tax=Geosmithia morbida TaxID=1094350 RepID=A0A9P4YZ55_9HYPO|nr:uncharacterized protein GMORB2_4999 [Geosmithia morbida]KAF4124333.1 hypothetical protein GMORB2_4999 [Geosmithia morbida]